MPPAPTNQTEQSLLGMGQMSHATLMYYPTTSKSNPIANFTAQIYATQIFQLEFVRTQIATYRRSSGLPQRTLGTLYWQLNDIWAAPTWASVEVGGRWKMLHYGSRDIFQPVIIAPYHDSATGNVEVWVTSDLWGTIQGTAELAWYDWSGNSLGDGAQNRSASVEVGPINSTSVWAFSTKDVPFPLDNAVAILSVAAVHNGTSYTHTNIFYPVPISSPAVQQNLRDPKLRLTHTGKTFVVESEAVAAWVWLDHPAAVRGYFTDNGFWMLPGKKEVNFVLQEDSTEGAWETNVTVSSLWDLTLP